MNDHFPLTWISSGTIVRSYFVDFTISHFYCGKLKRLVALKRYFMQSKNCGYNPGPLNNPFSKRRLMALLFVAWLSLFAGINIIPLEDHEALVLQTAREMGINQDWVVPYFNGEPRMNKPPLNYWLTSALSSLDPFSDDIEPWHGRAWPMLGGLLLLLFTAYIGNTMYGANIGIIAAALLLGTNGFTKFSHSARPDFLYSVLCVLQFYAWIIAWRAKDDFPAQRIYAGLGWMFAALATLSKGPQGPAVFLLGFLLFLLCSEERNRTVKILRPCSGLIIWIALCLPWWWLLQERVKTLGVNLGETQLSGALLKTLSGWQEILSLFYVSRLLLLMLPASLLLPVLLYLNRNSLRRPDKSHRWLIFPIATILLVFTIAGHYRPHYMLPLLPLSALFLAAGVERIPAGRLPDNLWSWLFRSGAATLAVFPALFIAKQFYATGLLLGLAGLLLTWLLTAELRAPFWRDHKPGARVLSCSLIAALLFAGFNAYSYRPRYAGNRDFSVSVGKMVNSGDVLLALGAYPPVLPYYARHKVVSAAGVAELKSRIADKTDRQNFYLVVRQMDLANLKDISTNTLLLNKDDKHSGKQIVLVQIL